MTDEEQPSAGGRPFERPVRPHSGDWMLPQEAERLAALWCTGQPLDDLPQWHTAMQVLVRELANARAGLKAANEQAERFEREWYLRGDALEAIHQYGSDTLSGRVDGPDDRGWQRAAVLEMTKRARLALEG